ncbi:Glycosyl transferase, group 2 protein, partial [Pseudomonas syringae pv. maculicola]
MASRQGVMNSRVGSKSENYAELYIDWLSCRQFT